MDDARLCGKEQLCAGSRAVEQAAHAWVTERLLAGEEVDSAAAPSALADGLPCA